MSDDPSGSVMRTLWRASLSLLGVTLVLWLTVQILLRIWLVLVIVVAICLAVGLLLRWWYFRT